MIVDDEILVRAGVKALIDWENYGYKVVCEAKDGREAKEKIQQFEPDIILTDLKMEPEDGLELIQYCRKEWPRIKLIVLSNYNDFENVRNAMKMGASDYVFKLMVKSEELLKILDEVSKDIEENDFGNRNEKKREIRKEFQLKRMRENTHIREEELGEILNEIFPKVDFGQKYKVIRLWVDNIKIVKQKEDFSKDSAMTRTIENTMYEIIERRFPVEIFRQSEGEFVAIINIGQGSEEKTIKETAKILTEYIYRYCGVHISLASSREKLGIALFQEALRETEEIKKKSFLRSRNQILEQPKEIVSLEMPEKFQIETMRYLVEQGNIKEMIEKWKEFFMFLEDNRDKDFPEVYSHLKKMYILLCFMFQSRQIDTESVTDSNGVTMEEALNGYDKLEDLKTSIYEVLSKLYTLEENCKREKMREEVEIVKSYVKNHLQEEITAAFVAKMVNMSVSHFSHVFKESTGMSFGEYVIQKRMNRAAKLLEETDLKISEIADAVGIDNPNYFSTKFKKAFSVSPSDYKKR